MTGEIKIKYDDVYSRTSELKNNISTTIACMENEYQAIQSMLDGLDSATNATLKEAMEENRQKALKVATTLDKLLSFMENSSRQVETDELRVENIFTSVLNIFRGGNR